MSCWFQNFSLNLKNVLLDKNVQKNSFIAVVGCFFELSFLTVAGRRCFIFSFQQKYLNENLKNMQ